MHGNKFLREWRRDSHQWRAACLGHNGPNSQCAIMRPSPDLSGIDDAAPRKT
jgi:hypothetical protein